MTFFSTFVICSELSWANETAGMKLATNKQKQTRMSFMDYGLEIGFKSGCYWLSFIGR
jgi:hypothetical protein